MRKSDLPVPLDRGPPLFFNDPLFEFIQFSLLPQLLEARKDAVRIWLPRCASGEDAYSIGMLALEAFESLGVRPLRILASEIDLLALEVARRGIYPHSAVAALSAPRREKFFAASDGGQSQVTRELREAILFSSQNILTDVPFSRLDLIFARGLLDGFAPEVRRNLLFLLHYALRDGGTLVVGRDEDLFDLDGLFTPSEEYPGVFHRIDSSLRRMRQFPILSDDEALRPVIIAPDRPGWLQHLVEQRLLEESAPAAVVIDNKLSIVSFYGPVHIYLHRPAKATAENIVDVVNAELRPAVLSAACRALQGGQRVAVAGELTRADGQTRTVNVVVRSIGARNLATEFMLVTFSENIGPLGLQNALANAERKIEQLTLQLRAAGTRVGNHAGGDACLDGLASEEGTDH